MPISKVFLLCATVSLLLTLAQGKAADAGRYVGTFKGPELSVEIHATNAGYGGFIKLGDHAFPLTAMERSGVLDGSFRSDDANFAFKATLVAETLTLTTEGTRYELLRQRVNPLAKTTPANPLAKAELKVDPVSGGGATDRAAESAPEPTGGPAQGAAWKTFRHPTGLSMSYPSNWRTQEHAQVLQLIPPDAGANADGPTEVYLVFAEGAEDITSAEDPRVLEFLQEQLGQLAPFLRPKGAPEKVRAGAVPGILATWEGDNPRGLSVRALALAAVLKGYGVALVGLGDQQQVLAREKTLRGIFASFAAGEGQKDPQLVGTWKYWHYSSSALGGFSTERTRFLVLRADGTCLWSSQSESSGSVRGSDSLGNQTYSAGTVGTSGSNDRGTWSAGGGKLYVMWQDGSLSEWAFTLSGAPGSRKLLLKSGDQQKPDEWMEQ
jgi:hypothetical protein